MEENTQKIPKRKVIIIAVVVGVLLTTGVLSFLFVKKDSTTRDENTNQASQYGGTGGSVPGASQNMSPVDSFAEEDFPTPEEISKNLEMMEAKVKAQKLTSFEENLKKSFDETMSSRILGGMLILSSRLASDEGLAQDLMDYQPVFGAYFEKNLDEVKKSIMLGLSKLSPAVYSSERAALISTLGSFDSERDKAIELAVKMAQEPAPIGTDPTQYGLPILLHSQVMDWTKDRAQAEKLTQEMTANQKDMVIKEGMKSQLQKRWGP